MKTILEGWRRFLNEQQEIFGVQISSDQRVFISNEPFKSFYNVQQYTAHSVKKPDGLWYSCGDSWVSWIQGEMPGALKSANYLYEIKLGSDVLKISADEDFDNFQHEYSIPPSYGVDVSIDWLRVSKSYSGIEICPLNREKRDEMFWYYGWDVASGCIWNSSGISRITLLAEREDKI